MISGNGSLSLRKKDLENQKIPSTGFQKMYAAHKAVAGATGINLSALSTPPEMSTNGFVNPTASQIAQANLLFFQNNLTLTSSARGLLQKNLSYVVAGSTQINFIGFTALEGEIFSITIDYGAITGLKVVDASATPATGTLPAGTTDFNIGQFFLTNKYSTTQHGACLVYMDGELQYRNTGNSSVVKDGNYYEVDNGGGSFTLIRFNSADPDTVRNISVLPNGLLSERPDGSMMAVIESIQGQVNSLAPYIAALAGTTTTNILGSAPTNVDLKAFGDRVLALEQTRAFLNATNTFTAPQIIPNISGATAIAGNTTITGTETVSGLLTATGGVSSSFYGSPTTFAVSVPNGTATTVYTFTTNTNPSLYLVFANIGTVNQAAGYGVLAYVVVDGTTARIITTTNPSAQSLALSGLNLQCTQGSGATQTVLGSITRLY